MPARLVLLVIAASACLAFEALCPFGAVREPRSPLDAALALGAAAPEAPWLSEDRPRLRGRVLGRGVPVAGARVVARMRGGATPHAVLADDEGRFELVLPRAGLVDLEIAAPLGRTSRPGEHACDVAWGTALERDFELGAGELIVRALDAESGDPLAGVTVLVEHEASGEVVALTTGEAGRLRFAPLRAGTHFVRVLPSARHDSLTIAPRPACTEGDPPPIVARLEGLPGVVAER